MTNPTQRIHTRVGPILVDTKLTSDGFRAIRDDVAKGRLSGIPECCIQFFAQVWSPKFDVDTLDNLAWREQYMGDIYDEERLHYVPCPHCKSTGHRSEIIVHVLPMYLRAWNLVPSIRVMANHIEAGHTKQ